MTKTKSRWMLSGLMGILLSTTTANQSYAIDAGLLDQFTTSNHHSISDEGIKKMRQMRDYVYGNCKMSCPDDMLPVLTMLQEPEIVSLLDKKSPSAARRAKAVAIFEKVLNESPTAPPQIEEDPGASSAA